MVPFVVVVVSSCSSPNPGMPDSGQVDTGFDAPIDSPADVADIVDAPADAGPCHTNADCATNASGHVCDSSTGRCVECLPSMDTCAAASHCDATTLTCVAGCHDDSGCTTSAAPHCDTTAHHCVACVDASQCPLGMLCAGNVCVAGCDAMHGCAAGQQCCSGGCVDVQTNVSNCGACGTACSVANGVAACVAGACTVDSCNAPFADCDHAIANGCESDTSTDLANCGGCGMACSFAHASATCAASACVLGACASGFADCDASASNGCETPTTSDPDNCGGCGVMCPSGSNCIAGHCDPPPPRLIAPLSTSYTTTRTPTLHWSLAPMTDGAAVQICGDLACTTVVATVMAAGTSVSVPSLMPGTYYWRAFGRAGTVQGTTPSATWEFVAPIRGSTMDSSYGSIFDWNLDGVADAIVGSNGSALIYRGNVGSGMTMASTATVVAGQTVVANAGDVNGDGFADALISVPSASRVYLVPGGTSPGTPVMLPTPTGTNVGLHLAGGGDLNGDGYGDVLVLDGMGIVRLYGSAGGLTTPTPLPAVSPVTSAVIIGDGNGDGLADLGMTGSGGFIRFTPNESTAWSTVTAPGFMTTSAAIGDVNADGRPDFVAGAPGFDPCAVIVLGTGSSASAGATITSFASNAGASVSGMTDVNRDGYMDIVVGSFGGRAEIVDGNSGIVMQTLSGTGSFAQAVAGLGDANGDGFGDVLIGNPGANTAIEYTRGATGLTVLATLSGTGMFGASVASIEPFAPQTRRVNLASVDSRYEWLRAF